MNGFHIKDVIQATVIWSSVAVLAACGGSGDTARGDALAPAPVITPAPVSEDGPIAEGPETDTPSPPPETSAPPAQPAPAPLEPTPANPPSVEVIPATAGDYVALSCDACHTTLHDSVVDDFGNATVVWAEDNQGNRSIKAARFTATTGIWERYFIASGSPETLQVGSDRIGNVKVAWVDANNFYMGHFEAASRTWSQPRLFFRATMIPTATNTFVVDADGDAFFTYLWLTGGTTAEGFPIQSAGAFVYTAATDTWKRGRIDEATEHALSPSIGLDSTGNAIATWGTRLTGEPGAFRGKVYVRRYRQRELDPHWAMLRQFASGGAFDPRIAVMPNGNAVVAYGTTMNGLNDILFRRFDASIATWSGTRPFGLNSIDPAHGLNAGVDRAGNAFFAWAQSQKGQQIRRYNAGTDSLSPIISYDDGDDFTVPGLAVDASGYAVHTFSDNARRGTTNLVHFNPSSTVWSSPAALNNPGEGGTTADAATSGASETVAVWRQSSGQTTAAGPVLSLKARLVKP